MNETNIALHLFIGLFIGLGTVVALYLKGYYCGRSHERIEYLNNVKMITGDDIYKIMSR